MAKTSDNPVNTVTTTTNTTLINANAPVNENANANLNPDWAYVSADQNSSITFDSTLGYDSFCLSGFPFQNGDSWNVGKIPNLVFKHFNGIQIPEDFVKEIRYKYSEGWNLSEFCARGRYSGYTEIFFSMVNIANKDIKVQIYAPKGTKGAPNLVGYWHATNTSPEGKYVPISFSQPIGVLGMGDIGLISNLSLIQQPGPQESKVLLRGLTGGGDGPGGWSMAFDFDPVAETIKVVQFCSYYNDGVTKNNTCKSAIF